MKEKEIVEELFKEYEKTECYVDQIITKALKRGRKQLAEEIQSAINQLHFEDKSKYSHILNKIKKELQKEVE